MSIIDSYNNRILASVSRNGLVPRRMNSDIYVGSVDTMPPPLCLNLIMPLRKPGTHSDGWLREGLDQLVWNQANGVVPVSLERPLSQAKSRQWIFFDDDQSSFERKVGMVYKSSVLFQVRFDGLPRPQPGFSFDATWLHDGGCQEFGFVDPIAPTAFQRAFVPESLTPLFQTHFPNLERISVGDITTEMGIWLPQEVADMPGFRRERVRRATVQVPDYESHVSQVAREHFGNDPRTKSPLAFHVVRLACEADRPFIGV